MENRLEELERKVEALTRAVDELRAQVKAPRTAAATEAPEPAAEEAPAELPRTTSVPAVPTVSEPTLPLVGRTLLAMAGAFVIRALTDRDIVPRGPGVALGLAFAAVWAVLAWRDASRGRRQSATWHGVAVSLIGFPLVVETGSRLAILSGELAAACLLAVTGAMVVTAWQHRVPLLGWLAVLGGGGSAGALLFATSTPAPFRVVLWAVAVASLAMADVRGWHGPRWPIAVFLDALMLRQVLATEILPDDAAVSPYGTAMALTQGTVVLYLGSLTWHTWRRKLPVQSFEVLQTLAVVGMGLGVLVRAQVSLGTPALVLALGSLFTAVHLGAQGERHEDAWFYGLVGLGLALLSGATWSLDVPLAAVWGALALGLAVIGRTRLPEMLWAFATVLAWATAGAGGLLAAMRSGLVDTPGVAWAPLWPGAALTLAVALAAYLAMTVRPPHEDSIALRVMALLLLALPLLGVTALGTYAVRALLGGTDANVAAVLATRTLLLIALAVAAVGCRRLKGPRELSWCAAMALGLCGLKLLAQDLPNGNAVTLVVGFLALGLAVTLLPKLLKRPPPASPA